MEALARATPRLRELTVADLPAAQGLSAGVGWPHRIADGQFARSVRQDQGELIRVDVDADASLSPWLTALGLAQVDELPRMSTAPLPVPVPVPVPAAMRRFAVVNQALG